MSDNDCLYVKKKHFYSGMVAVLFLILYAVEGKTVGDNKMNGYVHSFFLFSIMGYILYFIFLQIKLRYDKLLREGDKVKEDSKS